MNIELLNNEKYMLVVASGRLDAVTSDSFSEQVLAAVADNNNMIIDFSGLEYISSSGLRSVLVIGKKVAASQGYFSICGLAGPVLDVFKMSGFDAMIKICDTVQDAEAGLI